MSRLGLGRRVADALGLDGCDPALLHALAAAAMEGRLDRDVAEAVGGEVAQHRCEACGMSHADELDAALCCTARDPDFAEDDAGPRVVDDLGDLGELLEDDDLGGGV